MTDDPMSTDSNAEEGIGLCLSGGGYRAMIFHLGCLWRLYEAGTLGDVKRFSSVSGGSITSAQLGLVWDELSFDPAKTKQDFVPKVVDPIRHLARQTIDSWSIGVGSLWWGTIAEYVTDSYNKHLFKDKTLQDLTDSSRFVINATSLQSGVLCRFSKPYLRDYRVGEIKNPNLPIAQAVAASSAFPPFLSPCEIDVNPEDFTPGSGHDLQHGKYVDKLILTDGGVYDNLGLETVWKRYKTVLVSDGGGQMMPEEDPSSDWARQSKRIIDVIDNQVRSLRKRQIIDGYVAGRRKGTYWGIRTDISDYNIPNAGQSIDADIDVTTNLADTPTRLKSMPDKRQEMLINWGYAVSDAALRTYVDTSLPKGDLPFPQHKLT